MEKKFKRIAFIHDWLVFYGGADNIFFELIKNEYHNQENKKYIIEAKIFTLVSKEKSIEINGKQYEIITSLPKFINDIFIYYSTKVDTIKNPIHKLIGKLLNYRNLIVFYPLLMKILERKIKKFNPQKAIISSANISKNISLQSTTYTKIYIHSPLMYVDPEFQQSAKKFNIATQLLLKILTPLLTRRDRSYTTYNEVWANSFHTAQSIKKIYNIDAKVAYPHIPEYEKYLTEKPSEKIDNYYVYVGRLVISLRHVDRIIELFNQTGEKLIVLGDGADATYLKKIAKDNIVFLGQINDRQRIINIVKNAKGYINLAYESAGMSTAEALLLGVPVFGYNRGGTAELVEKQSGILTETLDKKHLLHTFSLFQKTIFDRNHIQTTIQKKLLHHGRSQMTK